MKNKLIFAIFIPLLVSGVCVNAQRFIDQRITIENGRSSLITFKPGSAAKDLAASDNEKFFSEIFSLPLGSKMVKTKSAKLFSDFADEKYQLYHNGLKVEFANYTLHYIKGNLVSMNGEMYDTSDVNTQPDITESEALNNAVKYAGVKVLMSKTQHGKEIGYQPKGELLLIPVQTAGDHYRLLLSYKFDVFSAEPFLRSYIYVDAKSGEILLDNPIMKHAGDHAHEKELENLPMIGAENQPKQDLPSIFITGNASTRYSGLKSIETSLVNNKYVLKDDTRGGGVNTYNNNNGFYTNLVKTNISDTDNNWTTAEHSANGNDVALDVHWGVEKTYDYFKNTFNRNSYDNQGAVLESYIHVQDPQAPGSYANAAWTGSEMIYGDGNGTFKPLTAFDVTAHELGHAICQEEAGLVYQKEPGAINEGLSDIWGAVVENTFAPEKQNFTIGEDIVKVSPYYLRSMSNPNSGLSSQPDTYKGTFWKNASSTCIPNNNPNSPGYNDSCGVHYNSGVLNHWFYLLVMGGSGTNDIGSSYNVSGIGFEKAAKIVYRIETSYLSANSTYSDLTAYGILAVKDLYGVDSPEHIATQNAFYAVGLGQAYAGGGNPVTDTQAPTAPQLSASSTTQNSTVLSWNGATDNVAVASYDVYRGITLLGTTSASTYTATGLSPATSYSFTVKAKDAAGNISVASNAVNVTTQAAGTGVSYCSLSASSAADENIGNVKFANINNSSTGIAGYENFTSIIGNVVKGTTYPLTITPNWPLIKFSEAYAVYIDFNGDGDFTDGGELAWSKAGSTTSPVTGNITIPATAVTGNVRMRVILKYNSVPTSPCGTISYGQVEDYTLKITSAGAFNSLISEVSGGTKAISIYPNPVKDVIKINSSSDSEFKYQLIDVLGKVVLSGETSAQTINVESLLEGVYILSLDNGKEKVTQKIIKK
ncbi:Por secretion system C-terminal sorting domain-containing protein [Chryseobacterium wanjuense]|uniref:Por secretion system C-terminal sorting domain-containing protein n=1 Tax=Chryseobacterium wanjuense TaxID=356305 RepID=A0A1I0QH21_9FLAO|nr:M4 family metallopeptidase [Chryseobacterium wanjuense]SEW26366.1 Por secretion system C-terminal sorting domain-containing protein [Chryseobacterium wanjuense]